MSVSDEALKELADRVSAGLAKAGARVATAESCTGGWLAKVLTDRPGCSESYGFGYVTYSNEAKHALLDVPAESLERHGAVSAEVAEQMATGARLASGAELAVAITGIAGPEGGTPDKPVGTVWFAWSGPGSRLESARRQFEGDREAVRRRSVRAALEGLLERLPR